MTKKFKASRKVFALTCCRVKFRSTSISREIQCDQTVTLFFYIWPFAILKIFPITKFWPNLGLHVAKYYRIYQK